MTIITVDKQLVHGKEGGDQRGKGIEREKKVIESFGGTFR